MPDPYVEQAETLIIRGAFRVIDADPRVQKRWEPRRLMEVTKTLASFGVGTLGVTGIPVRPKGLPTLTEDIFVDIGILLYLPREETTEDSKLALTNEFNEFRKLLVANTPLRDDAGRSVSDDVVYSFYFAGVDTSVKGVRIALFIARYQSKINPKTGEQSS